MHSTGCTFLKIKPILLKLMKFSLKYGDWSRKTALADAGRTEVGRRRAEVGWWKTEDRGQKGFGIEALRDWELRD